MAAPTLTTYSLSSIVEVARERCPFYRQLYAGLGSNPALPELPIVDSDAFWRAHHRNRLEVLTGPPLGGIVLNSGGTTGTPKFSYFNDEEWDSAVSLTAHAGEAAGVRDGDRIANLFAAGNLNASLLVATEGFKAMKPDVLQFPIAYSPNFAAAAGIIRLFDLNTLAGFPTHLLRLIEHMDQEDGPRVQLRRIIFGGELFSADQRAFLERRFPGVSIRSFSYASVDAGTIAFADASCAPGEHRVFDGATVVEICDEATDEPIEEVDRPGRIVFTSLTRCLMPLLRYPTGDLARWVDPPGTADRRFALLGRSNEAARVSAFTVPVSGVRDLLEPLRQRLGLGEFQMLVTREDMIDRLTLRVVGGAPSDVLASGAAEILEAFHRWQPELAAEMKAGIVHPPQVEWIEPEALIVSERTGKLRRVVDHRAG